MELKFIRKAEKEKSMPKDKKYGGVWKDIVKLASLRLNNSFLLCIYDTYFDTFLSRHDYMRKSEGYVLKNMELENAKNWVLNTKSVAKELGKYKQDIDDVKQISIIITSN